MTSTSSPSERSFHRTPMSRRRGSPAPAARERCSGERAWRPRSPVGAGSVADAICLLLRRYEPDQVRRVAGPWSGSAGLSARSYRAPRSIHPTPTNRAASPPLAWPAGRPRWSAGSPTCPPDPVDAQLPEEALRDVLPHVAAAAEDLDGSVRDPSGGLRRVELGHRALRVLDLDVAPRIDPRASS